uniref:Syndecan n=1 Tax=Lepisosteus oculatus TaxID=7918 RepID=W5MCX4_LEPOC
MKLPCLIALGSILLLLGDTATAYRWPRASEEVGPMDTEGSTDDGFIDDEDLYSGSGSGFPVVQLKPRNKVTFSTEVPVSLSTTQATSPAPSVPPAAMPTGTQRPLVEPGENEKESSSLATESGRQEPGSSASVPMATTSSATTTAQQTVPTTSATDLSTTEEVREDVFIPEETEERRTTALPTAEPAAAVTTTITATTAVLRRRKTMSSTPTVPTAMSTTAAASAPGRNRPWAPATATPTAAPSSSTVRLRPAQTTTLLPRTELQTEQTTSGLFLSSTAQTDVPDGSLTNEVGLAGPSGDFEIEDGNTSNEIVKSKTKEPEDKVEPDFTGNTIDTGSSAAQLPQKNILERKEVLIAVMMGGLLAVVFADFLVIAVIVGGVVGALFAAFLVMLLVYRMKKKDEGSYTLEEPKQATVTYQKPDKQEEFYA